MPTDQHRAARSDVDDDLQTPVATMACVCFVVALGPVLAALAASVALAPSPPPAARVFTGEELCSLAAAAQASSSAPLPLVIVGQVYDVSAGREHYVAREDGEDESYAGFVGRDASRAFLSADFAHNATDDLDDLLPGQCLSIEHWQQFYRNHEKYMPMGMLRGRFYDATALPTEARRRFDDCIEAGRAVRGAAREAITAASDCDESTPRGEARFEHGAWATYACEPPLVPRRATLPELGQRCVCLSPSAAGGWEPVALGMEDDPEMPQLYDRNAEPAASTVTVRIG